MKNLNSKDSKRSLSKNKRIIRKLNQDKIQTKTKENSLINLKKLLISKIVIIPRMRRLIMKRLIMRSLIMISPKILMLRKLNQKHYLEKPHKLDKHWNHNQNHLICLFKGNRRLFNLMTNWINKSKNSCLKMIQAAKQLIFWSCTNHKVIS